MEESHLVSRFVSSDSPFGELFLLKCPPKSNLLLVPFLASSDIYSL